MVSRSPGKATLCRGGMGGARAIMGQAVSLPSKPPNYDATGTRVLVRKLTGSLQRHTIRNGRSAKFVLLECLM